MSLTQKVRLALDDGREIETTYDGRDLRAWEAEHHKSSLVEDMSLGMLTWLSHHAAVRRGELNGDLRTYAAFDKVCTSVEGVRDPEPAAPPDPPKRTKASRKSPGGDSSAPSP